MAKRSKAAKETSAKTSAADLVPQPHGGALRRGGKPGNKGGGRHPDWLKDFCDDLLASDATKAQVEAILADKDHPAFAAMWRACGDRAKGKPHQTIETENKHLHQHAVVILPPVKP